MTAGACGAPLRGLASLPPPYRGLARGAAPSPLRKPGNRLRSYTALLAKSQVPSNGLSSPGEKSVDFYFLSALTDATFPSVRKTRRNQFSLSYVVSQRASPEKQE